jgi:hypothetical protein
VLFDNSYELLHDRINVKGISPITVYGKLKLQ